MARKKGSKNLQREGNKIVNQFGVAFTEKEKKELESLVNSANRKRKRMLEQERQLPRIVAGKSTGKTIGATTGLMGKESDFILAPKTKSMQRFRNRQEFKKYIKNLKKVTDRDYVDKRVEKYRKNHIKGLKNVFGADAKSIVKKLKSLTRKEYMKLIQSDETLDLGYIYEPQEYDAKLEQIRESLGV